MRGERSIKIKGLEEDGLKRKLGKLGTGSEFEWKFVDFWRCKGSKGWEKRARVESKGEDVTPTAVAKEVIGLRPCARYPNRGRRREPTGDTRPRGADARVYRWTRAATIGGDRPTLPRAPPIREGVSRPFAGCPPTTLAAGRSRARGCSSVMPTPSKFECRIAL